VREAVDMGARIVAGGGWAGQVHEPTILVDVPGDATIAFEETFGPVVIVQPVDDALEAVDVVNSSMYGLSTAILCADTFHGIELAAYVKSGAVHINIPTVDDEVQAPIGGVRDSGWGRTGTYGLQDFSDYIWINAQSGERHLPIK
jgi:acyl-CoA reductase-like NAD-dependent aldehyde dehydrogenase